MCLFVTIHATLKYMLTPANHIKLCVIRPMSIQCFYYLCLLTYSHFNNMESVNTNFEPVCVLYFANLQIHRYTTNERNSPEIGHNERNIKFSNSANYHLYILLLTTTVIIVKLFQYIYIIYDDNKIIMQGLWTS